VRWLSFDVTGDTGTSCDAERYFALTEFAVVLDLDAKVGPHLRRRRRP
jgi:hypothetical protein